jgi:hypothetical protein
MEETMKPRTRKTGIFCSLFLLISLLASADRRGAISNLAVELERRATELALNNFEHFKGWNGVISDEEQAVLFKSEAFSASSRLFLRLAEESSDYFSTGYLRTNLYNAFTYIVRAFKEFEEEMKQAGVMPYALADCGKTLQRMEYEFSQWPSADNLAYLHQKYVKAQNAAVYMIERKDIGVYVRHAFKNLESLWRYNYDLNRGKDPWKYLVEVPEDTLEKMEEGDMIDLTFEGRLIIEQSNRPNRPVYLIEKGKRRGITNPRVLMRFGGWSKVYEVPSEIIDTYPEGEAVY